MNALAVYTVGDLCYGISEDREPLSIDIRDIHWLPPVSQHIAGITVLDEHTVTLFDLRACLGLPSMPRNRQKYLLLRTDGDGNTPPAAFVFPDTVGRSTITPDAINPLPEYLVSSVIQTYTVCESKPVWIIDTAELYRQAQAVEFTPPQGTFAVSSVTTAREVADCDYTIVDAADHRFALPDTCVVASDACGSTSHPIRPAPPFIAGVEICEDSPVPLIDLAKRLSLKTSSTSRLMLDVELDRQRFRFCVDALLPPISAAEARCKQLPALLQNNWRQTALVRNEEIISIVNLNGLLSGQPDSDIAASVYRPQSTFPSSFEKEEVDIVEFELCGLRHALPGNEAKPAIGMLPVSGVSNAKPLVAGVSEYEGELLPVLDLSRCFGRNAAPTASWSMIPVGNGNFKALILAERSYSPRALPVELHRDLPYENTENFVYGCFPEEVLVRLIFNVHALAIHFDRARHQEFFEALAEVTQSSPDLEDNSPMQQAMPADDRGRFAPVDSQAPDPQPGESIETDTIDTLRLQTDEPPVSEPPTTESQASPQALLARRLQKAVPFPEQTSPFDADAEKAPTQEDDNKWSEEQEGSGIVEEVVIESSERSASDRMDESDKEQDAPDREADFDIDNDIHQKPQLTSEKLPEADSIDTTKAPDNDPEPAAAETIPSNTDVVLQTQPGLLAGRDSESFATETGELPDDADGLAQPRQAGAETSADEIIDPDVGSQDCSADITAQQADVVDKAPSKQPIDRQLPVQEPADKKDAAPTPDEKLSGAPDRSASTTALTIDADEKMEPEDIDDQAQTAPEEAGLNDPEIPEQPQVDDLLAEFDELLPEEDIFIEDEIEPETEEDAGAGEDVLEEKPPEFAFSDQQGDEGYPAAGGFQETAQLLPDSSAPAPRRSRKKIMGLCLVALLVIVASAAFTGWRLGWLRKANPVQVIHHPVSDLDAAKVPVKALKPLPRPVAAKPKPFPRPPAAAPAADIRSKKSSTAPAPAAEAEEETRTIRIIDKDGRLVVYKVKKGDTLWGISEKYTGTGFNYPKLADDNRIKNPDLIFPRQRIKVK